MAATGDLPSLPAAVAVAAYRIALEALNNVLRGLRRLGFRASGQQMGSIRAWATRLWS